MSKIKKIKTIKQEGTNVWLGPVRLSYAHLLQPFQPKDGKSEPKYMTNVLIPESETKAIKAVEAAIETAVTAGLADKLKGVPRAKIDSPLRDGADKENGGEEYQDAKWLNAKSGLKHKPFVCDRNYAPIMDPEEIYGGVWTMVKLSFYPYNTNGKKGIGCGIEGVMKLSDGERLGGDADNSRAFDGVTVPDDDELDDDDM